MTMDLTREEMIERLVEDSYDGMDYKDLWSYVEYYLTKEYEDWSTETLAIEYSERFGDEDDDDE